MKKVQEVIDLYMLLRGSNIRGLCSLLILIGGFCAFPINAMVKINTNDLDYSPVSIYITNFASLDGLGTTLSDVVAKDLQGIDLFNILPKNSFKYKLNNPDNVPRFEDWEKIGSQLLVMGRVVKEGSNRLRVEFRIWDVKERKQIFGKKFFTVPEDWRRIAHIISDEIYYVVTGERSYFNTRILFVSESIVSGVKKRRLCVMDQDGHNVRYLTPDSDNDFGTPRFSPNQYKIAYSSNDNDNDNILKVYLMNIRTGQDPKRVGNFGGIVFTPQFSYNGNRMIMSVQKEESIDIYDVELYSNSFRRLTNTLSSNLSPSYSPDSSQIVFESDRDGKPQLYTMKSDGSGQKCISSDTESSYYDPAWSPKGGLIAFTKLSGSLFSIGVMNVDGSNERIIVKDAWSPVWSPSGRFLMFTRRKNSDEGSKLYSINLNGRNERAINTPAYASNPHWVDFID